MLLVHLLLACADVSVEVQPTEPKPQGPVAARQQPVSDTFHGVTVTEPYRWLEDASSPEVQAWTSEQDRAARTALAALPGREQLKAELAKILGHERVSHHPIAFGGTRVFAERHQPPRQQSFLVVLDSLTAPGEGRVVLDPVVRDPEALTTIDWWVPSPDGSKVAVSLSRAGTESGDLVVIDASTGAEVDPGIPRVNGGTAGGALAWAPDGSGFYYTRYPRDGERGPEDMSFYTQLWYHPLGGDPAQDRYEIGKDFPRIAEIDIEVHPGTGRVLATVQNGDGGEFEHHLRAPDGTWRKLTAFDQQVDMVTFSEDGARLYAVSFRDAPRGRILAAPVDTTDLPGAPVFVPEGEHTIVTSFWTEPSLLERRGIVYAEVQTGGPSELRAWAARDGSLAPAPTTDPVSSVGSLVPTPEGHLVFSAGSFVKPGTWYLYDGSPPKELPLNGPSLVDLSKVEVRREFAVSKDGTRVPVNILVPPNASRNGHNPAILTGYGGYGVSLEPGFRDHQAPLLDRGVIVAIANLRGGGEYGEEWHLQGNLTHKQNVFDDFHAAMQLLVERGYTSPDKLGIIGGSNGGLLMGATFTQHPEAAAAVVSSVGIYDMLRVELSPNGAFNISEFGTVADPEQFAALHAYSPYHHVREGVRYPPILFTTGANDPRVDPMQSRKMTARLQAAGAPQVLLRVDGDAGHGGGMPLDARVELLADQYAFLLAHIAPGPQG